MTCSLISAERPPFLFAHRLRAPVRSARSTGSIKHMVAELAIEQILAVAPRFAQFDTAALLSCFGVLVGGEGFEPPTPTV